MADQYLSLLKGVIARLKAQNVVAGDRVYTDIPERETFPYVFVQISQEPNSTKGSSDFEYTIQCQAFDRQKDPESVAQIRQNIYDALDRQPEQVTLDSGSLDLLQVNGTSDIVKEPDGVVWQSLIQFYAIVT